ncbi:hypothetical protein Ddc_09694 [Ditylenchus destructor]|nr:hypothetical protein Ddc_09694 [Ditylenchus destructor]
MVSGDGSSFEDAVFLFFQAFQPHIQLDRSAINFDDVRNFITKYFLHSNKSPSRCPHDIVKSLIAQSATKLVNSPIDFNETAKFFTFPGSPGKSRSNSENSQNGKVERWIKLGSKGTNNNGECVIINCHESELLDTFKLLLRRLVKEKSSASECYYILLNSLALYFSTTSWITKCGENVAEFVRQFILDTNGELWQSSADSLSAQEKLCEIQVICLLELFRASSTSDISIDELYIIPKLRLLRFVFGHEELSQYVSQVIYPEFNSQIPHLISTICEQMQVQIPVAKLEMNRRKNRLKQEASSPPGTPVRRRSQVSVKMEEDFEATDEGVKEEQKDDSSGTSSNETAAVPVPPMTRNNLKKLARISSSESDDVKMEGIKEEKPVINTKEGKRKPKKNGIISTSRTISKKIVSRSKAIEKKQCSQKFREKPPKKLAAVGKRRALAATTASLLVTGPRKSAMRIETADEVKNETKKPPPSLIPTPIPVSNNARATTGQTASSKDAICALNDKVIARYKTRIENIRTNARKYNVQEIFYGRTIGRQGLFDYESNDEESQQSSASSYAVGKSQSTKQKNRSGRAVKRQDDCVYVAHTLLNVHNPRPLSPFKVVRTLAPADGSTFKIRKFIKRASRKKLKRIEKYQKSRMQQQNHNSAI